MILLLDSDSVMRAALRDALQDAGYVVESVSELGEAVDRLDEVRPDLLITRPYINSMPGRTAASYLRSRYPGLAVLIVAGFIDDDRITTQSAVGQFEIFPQPFPRRELQAKVREMLDRMRSRSRSTAR
jgi:two-component system response regulator YesN